MIQVDVVHDTASGPALHGITLLPVADITAVTEANPSRPPVSGEASTLIVLRSEAPSVPWVFRFDSDSDTAPRELGVRESVQQVTGLIALARRLNRPVSTKDMGEAAAAAVRGGLRGPLEVFPSARFKPRPKSGLSD